MKACLGGGGAGEGGICKNFGQGYTVFFGGEGDDLAIFNFSIAVGQERIRYHVWPVLRC